MPKTCFSRALYQQRVHKELPKALVFNKETEIMNPTFRMGIVFKSARLFREAIHHYWVKNGTNIRFVKNGNNKIRAKCKENCLWVLYASTFEKRNPTLKVKTDMNKHACGRTRKNKNVTSTWVAKIYTNSQQQGKNSFLLENFL